MSTPAAGEPLPEWEQVLSAAARLQQLFPDAVLARQSSPDGSAWRPTNPTAVRTVLRRGLLIGGTAAGLHAGHRTSRDADHVLTDLRLRFDRVLGRLEAAAGWKTARVSRPVLILGSLDGIETGIRQLVRSEPLETTTASIGGQTITIPTEAELLRIKGFLLLRRNATRDYVDFAALADRMGDASTAAAFERFDRLYPQDNGESPLQQLLAQLASPMPYDLEGTALSEYKHLRARWHDWNAVRAACAHAATAIFDRDR